MILVVLSEQHLAIWLQAEWEYDWTWFVEWSCRHRINEISGCCHCLPLFSSLSVVSVSACLLWYSRRLVPHYTNIWQLLSSNTFCLLLCNFQQLKKNKKTKIHFPVSLAGGGGEVSLGMVSIKTFGFPHLCQSLYSTKQSNSISDSACFYSDSVFEQSVLCGPRWCSYDVIWAGWQNITPLVSIYCTNDPI